MQNANKKQACLQIVDSLDGDFFAQDAINIASAAAKNGWRSLLASSGGGRLQALGRRNITHITLPFSYHRLRRGSRAMQSLITHVRDLKPDIIHSHSAKVAQFGAILADSLMVPHMTSWHSRLTKNDRRQQRALAGGSNVLVTNRAMQRVLMRQFPESYPNIRLIRKGVDTESFQPGSVSQPRIIQLARQWAIDESSPVFLVPFAADDYAVMDTLTAGLGGLKARKFRCLITGDDTKHSRNTEQLRRRIRRHKIEAHVQLITPYQDIQAALLLAEAVIIPSVDHPHAGRRALEAMAMGKIVIGIDDGELADLIVTEETGILIPNNHATSWARAVLRVLEQQEKERQKIKTAAVKTVHEQFTLEKAMGEILELYSKACQ